VGAGGHRTGDRLRVDVAQVGHGEAELVQGGVQLAQRGAGPDGDQPGAGVRVVDAVPSGQVDGDPVGRRGRGERVARADRPDGQPVAFGVLHRVRDLLRIGRPAPAGRLGRRRAGPVPP
jgi:hypothetical protein